MTSHTPDPRRLRYLAFVLLVGFCAPVVAEESEEQKTWEGKWLNRRFGTNGTLTCTTTKKDDNTWEGRFEGSFRGRAFNYTVTFSAIKKGNQTNLKGNATLGRERYQWAGYVRGQTLYGEYRSSDGNYGAFQLRETKGKR